MIKAIKERRSVRTYSGQPLDEETKARLMDFAGNIENPWGIPVEFRVLEGSAHHLKCPVVTGTDLYVGGIFDVVGWEGLNWEKNGPADLHITKTSDTAGSFRIREGAIVLDGDGALGKTNALELAGGEIAVGAFTNRLGALSVTADLNFLMIWSSVSRMAMQPLGLGSDLDIFLSGFCRDITRAAFLGIKGSGTVNRLG